MAETESTTTQPRCIGAPPPFPDDIEDQARWLLRRVLQLSYDAAHISGALASISDYWGLGDRMGDVHSAINALRQEAQAALRMVLKARGKAD